MKSKNYTKSYLKSKLTLLSKRVNQCKYKIHSCEVVLHNEKQILNNSKLAHDRLWTWRDELKDQIRLKKIYEKELKETHRLYLNMFYPQYNKNNFCYIFL